MAQNNASDDKKDTVTRAPEAGETEDRNARRGTPTGGGAKDDVRNAPEAGDKTKDSTGK
ncbi:MAG TPA: hypothetical protein VGN72_08755 [Tepidisphaeraceae bacterium]|jgi:hypothetical protein|nr:hypothetical protein [Tepidisphaeraceae bacterium]